MELAVGHRTTRVRRITGLVRLPGPGIPDDHVAAAVLPGRDDALEVEVVHWVILDVEGGSPYAWVQRRALRDGPAHEHTVDFEPKVVVQTASAMPLHHEPARVASRSRRRGARWLRRPGEVPLASVGRQRIAGRRAGAGRRHGLQ